MHSESSAEAPPRLGHRARQERLQHGLSPPSTFGGLCPLTSKARLRFLPPGHLRRTHLQKSAGPALSPDCRRTPFFPAFQVGDQILHTKSPTPPPVRRVGWSAGDSSRFCRTFRSKRVACRSSRWRKLFSDIATARGKASSWPGKSAASRGRAPLSLCLSGALAATAGAGGSNGHRELLELQAELRPILLRP